MIEFFSSLFSSPIEAVTLFCCALLIGMSKTGMQGINVIAIPFMAIAFGAKASTGVILPMLCFADLLAVFYYRRDAEWKYIFKLLPAAIGGFFLAIWVDKMIDPLWFKNLMGLCIIGGLLVMFATAKQGKTQKNSLSQTWWYSAAFGLAGGFTTMIGNAAGPVMAVYLLSVRLPKLGFVGTSAWFFLVVNFLKLPLQYFVWDNISTHTLLLNLTAIPFIVVGAIFGIWFVRLLPERSYRIFVIVVTLFSTLLLFV